MIILRDTTAGAYCKPTAQDILDLQVGDYVPDCFGLLSKIVEITFRGIDVNGKGYVGYYTQWHDDSMISGSLKEGEYLATVPMTNKYHTTANYPK